VPHDVARVPVFAAAMKAVMMPGDEQAKVFSPIKTIGRWVLKRRQQTSRRPRCSYQVRSCLPHAAIAPCTGHTGRPHFRQPSYLPWATGGERHMAAVWWPFQRGWTWRLISCTQGQALTTPTSCKQPTPARAPLM
jgi:hypothetical protein